MFTNHPLLSAAFVVVIIVAIAFMVLNRKDKDRKQAFLVGFIVIAVAISGYCWTDYEDKYVPGLLIEGVACKTDSDCLYSNCAPTWSEQKFCSGDVKTDLQAKLPAQCESGVFMTGTNVCAPNQFKICVRKSNVMIYVWNEDSELLGVHLTGEDGCWVSDPARNHRRASENSDLRGECKQYTHWKTEGAPCELGSGDFTASWDTGRIL